VPAPASPVPPAAEHSIAALTAPLPTAPRGAAICVPPCVAQLALLNSSGWVEFVAFAVHAGYYGCALYNEKEQSTDSNGTDVWE
jgi:hypothetical protein